MTVVDETLPEFDESLSEGEVPTGAPPDRGRPLRATGHDGERRRDGGAVEEDGGAAVVKVPGRAPRGMRIRRVRIQSAAKLAAVFFLLGYVVTMGTLVVLWNVGQRLGFVTDFEDLVETSLGLDSFDVTGADLFELAAVALGIVFAIGLIATVLLTIVYNAACMLLGGLAIETGPLRRPRKVFSLRHRRFIDVR